eukprot:354185-Chlamydomonas_euryale.AAC.7
MQTRAGHSDSTCTGTVQCIYDFESSLQICRLIGVSGLGHTLNLSSQQDDCVRAQLYDNCA